MTCTRAKPFGGCPTMVASSPRIVSALLAFALFAAASAAQAEVTISDQPTRAMKCAKGVCKPKKAKANLNVSDLANMLAAGDVKVVSDSAAIDIRFTAPLSWTSSSRLTIDSYHSIIFEQPVSVAGAGAVTIATNDGGSEGDFWFTPNNHLEFWDLNSSLIINGQSYKLVKTVHALARDVGKHPSGFFAFAKSYDAKKDGTYAQSPVGVIQGTFEGLGNAISNVAINDPNSHTGVAFTDGGGTIHNVNIVNINVYAPLAGDVAGLATAADVIHSSVSGTVTGGGAGAGGAVGGLTAFNGGEILYSHAAVNVNSLNDEPAGGLVGQMPNLGNVRVEQSYATGNVISGSCCAGGLVGNVYAQTGTIVPTIAYSYATGSVTGVSGSSIGGLVGQKVTGTVESFATGLIVGGADICSGGFVGADFGVAQNGSDYWDVDTSNASTASCSQQDGDVVGLTTAQFKSGLPNGFDPTIWGQNPSINNGYPYLIANPPPQ